MKYKKHDFYVHNILDNFGSSINSACISSDFPLVSAGFYLGFYSIFPLASAGFYFPFSSGLSYTYFPVFSLI